jgi:hypothetical protein
MITFVADRWLGGRQGGGSCEVELLPASEETWQVVVVTGDVVGPGEHMQVALQMHGSMGGCTRWGWQCFAPCFWMHGWLMDGLQVAGLPARGGCMCSDVHGIAIQAGPAGAPWLTHSAYKLYCYII